MKRLDFLPLFIFQNILQERDHLHDSIFCDILPQNVSLSNCSMLRPLEITSIFMKASIKN